MDIIGKQIHTIMKTEILTKSMERKVIDIVGVVPYEIIYILAGKGKQTIEVTMNLQKQGSSCNLTILSSGFAEEAIVRSHQNHEASNTKSNVLVKSIVPKHATFRYDGFILIENQLRGSNAYQKNQNIVLSETSLVVSNPTLEIKNNDVICSHGVSTSPIPSDPLWYMTSRGISLQKAKSVYLEGFIYDAVEKLKDSKIKTMLYNQIYTLC